MSRSSSVVAYRPAGTGQKDRRARFDLGLIPDPRAWLEQRLGPLAHFEVIDGAMPDATPRAAGGSGDAAAKGDGVAASALDQRPIAGTDVPAPSAPDDTVQAPDAIRDRVAARARLADLSTRLDAVIHQRIANDRASLAALSARLEAARPSVAAA
jgi:putative DNA primase/helicase